MHKKQVTRMRGLITLNKNEQSPCCQICVYYNDGDCVKKKRKTEPFKKCRKFELDITTIGAKRKRGTETEINPENYSIY